MEISLSRSSWHAKYHNFVKGYYPTYEFKSLCPYFWTIVLFILLSPVIVLWKVFSRLTVKPFGKVINYWESESGVFNQPSKHSKEPSKFSKWCGRYDKNFGTWLLRIYFGLMVSLLIFAIITFFEEMGFWLGITYIFAGIGGLTTLLLSVWGLLSFFENDSWKMIKGMAYSIKNKVCPMITWKNDEDS